MRWRRRCVVCGNRLRWWQRKLDLKTRGVPRIVHVSRRYAGTDRGCLEVFAIAMESGLGDMFFDTQELQ